MGMFNSKLYWFSILLIMIICSLPMTVWGGACKGLLCSFIWLLGEAYGRDDQTNGE